MPARARVEPEFGRAVREAMGPLSQSEVALRSQISVGYINRMARGSVPSAQIIQQLAEALFVDPAPLLDAAGYTSSEREAKRPVVRPWESASYLADDGGSRDEILGPMAAAQYQRELWDRFVAYHFPDARMPSGAGIPLTRSAILTWLLGVLRDLIEAEEDAVEGGE